MANDEQTFENETYTLVDEGYFIDVTKEQFDEFDENTDLEQFIIKYNLVRKPAETKTKNPNVQSMCINKTRATVNLSAHDIPSSGMDYYDADGDYFFIRRGGSFKISATFSSPEYPGVWIGYTDHNSGNLTGRSGGTKTRNESWKFTTDRAVIGYMEAQSGNVHLSKGSITWTKL